MKKSHSWRIMLLALLLIGALCACGGGAGETPDEAGGGDVTTSAPDITGSEAGNENNEKPSPSSPPEDDAAGDAAVAQGDDAAEDAAVAATAVAAPPSPPSSNPEKIGSFTTYDLDQNIVTQAILADHELTMFHVWSTALSTSTQEMAIIAALNEKYAEQGFQTIGIVVDVVNADGSMNAGKVAKAKFAAADSGADYPHILPSQELLEARLNAIELLPVSFFVTADGTFVGEHHIGSRAQAEWETTIEALLARQP